MDGAGQVGMGGHAVLTMSPVPSCHGPGSDAHDDVPGQPSDIPTWRAAGPERRASGPTGARMEGAGDGQRQSMLQLSHPIWQGGGASPGIPRIPCLHCPGGPFHLVRISSPVAVKGRGVSLAAPPWRARAMSGQVHHKVLIFVFIIHTICLVWCRRSRT